MVKLNLEIIEILKIQNFKKKSQNISLFSVIKKNVIDRGVAWEKSDIFSGILARGIIHTIEALNQQHTEVRKKNYWNN